MCVLGGEGGRVEGICCVSKEWKRVGRMKRGRGEGREGVGWGGGETANTPPILTIFKSFLTCEIVRMKRRHREGTKEEGGQ